MANIHFKNMAVAAVLRGKRGNGDTDSFYNVSKRRG